MAELARQNTDGWRPSHPATEATWEPRRLIEESAGISYADVQAMLPEEVAAGLDFLQIVRDSRLWQADQAKNG